MNPKKFALWGGLLMLVLGAVSLVPALTGTTEGLPHLLNENSYGLFLGFFPMNIFNKTALVLFGLLGVAAATEKNKELPASIRFGKAVAVVMGLAAVLGVTPFRTFFGYWPLFGGEVLAHAAFALAGAYFGFVWKPRLLSHRNVLYLKNRGPHRVS